MHIRMLFLLVPLCLTLSACGGSVPEPSGGADAPEQAAGIDETEILLRVDGREVPAWQYLYWLARSCDRAGDRARAAGTALVWDDAAAEAVRAEALADTALYASVENLAARYGCVLDARDEAEAEAQWQERCQAHGGADAYLRVIARYGLDRERAIELFRTGLLYGKLCALCRSGGALCPDAAVLDALEQETGLIRVDRILVSGDRDGARGQADALFTRLNGAANQTELFSALAAQWDDPAGPRTLASGGLDGRLSEIARMLRPGQLSGIVETGEGCSILLRLPADREALLDLWLDRTLQSYAAAARTEASDRLLAIDPASFARNLETLRERLDSSAA